MKFHCPRCTSHETFKLLQEIIDTKDASIQDKIEIINLLKKQIEELAKENITSREYKHTQISYAHIASKPVETKENVPDLIIRPRQTQELSKTKTEVMEKLNPAELNIGIKNKRIAENGNLVIKCSSKQEAEKLRRAAENTLEDNKYEIHTTKMLKPKIKIPGYEGNKGKKEIEECIRRQNPWITDSDQLYVTFIKQKKNKHESTIFAECSGGMFYKLMRYKKVHIEWNRCPVYEDLKITRCFKCQGLYHKNNKCEKHLVCEYCAGNHGVEVCQKTSKKCNNCVQANSKFKTNHCVSHAASDPECPSYKYHIEILKNKIDYNL